MNRISQFGVLVSICIAIMTGCGRTETSTRTPPVPEKATDIDSEGTIPTISTKTPTLVPPTSTPSEVFAALVNGEGILLADYESELTRFRAVSGTGLATYGEERVLDDMIDQVLLAQAAAEQGFIVDDTTLEERIQNLGISAEDLEDWKTSYSYSEDSFDRALSLAIASAWMRDKIISEAPNTAEQVHARQILLYNSTDAEEILTQLDSGTDFVTIAEEVDPLTKGDLGWFPRGYLNITELDETLFTLEPGEYSDIIKTPLGYHIVQVIDRELDHPLTENTRRVIQLNTLAEWLETQRELSEIVILIP
jgi:peptidyl-prolyl cis-trans isomerase C